MIFISIQLLRKWIADYSFKGMTEGCQRQRTVSGNVTEQIYRVRKALEYSRANAIRFHPISVS